jgi:hypothetical protein
MALTIGGHGRACLAVPLPEAVAGGNVAVRDDDHSSAMAWALATTASTSSVVVAKCVEGQHRQFLRRDVGRPLWQRVMGVRQRTQLRVMWRAGGLVAVVVVGELQFLSLAEVSRDENPISFLEGRQRHSNVVFYLEASAWRAPA